MWRDVTVKPVQSPPKRNTKHLCGLLHAVPVLSLIHIFIIGLVGSTLPLILIRVVYSKFISFVMTKFGFMTSSFTFASAHDIFVILVPLGLGIGAGIGFIGSILSIRKHLKV